VDEAAFEQDREFIKAMIRYRIDEALFGKSQALRHLVPVDPQARLGLASFVEAEKLPGLVKASAKAH
jgi:hypothetical protein